MIRKIPIGLTAAAAWAGALSSAHAASPKTFTVTGHVTSTCSLGASTGSLLINTTVPASGKLDASVDGTSFALTGLYCDAPSSIRLSATALRRNPPNDKVPNGQSQAANYTATATGWSSTPAIVTTSEASPFGSTMVFTGTPRSQPSAKSGNLTVTVNNFTTVVGANGNGQKLMDGPYSATITVSLTPGS
jgi:hypothetical protein